MKILLDECVTKKVKPLLAEHQTFTVTEMGWSGLKNGKLMAKAIENQFDVLLTIDKNLAYQQNIKQYALAIVILDTPTSKLEAIKPLLPSFLARILSFEKGNAHFITLE